MTICSRRFVPVLMEIKWSFGVNDEGTNSIRTRYSCEGDAQQSKEITGQQADARTYHIDI